jgi:hypothetical protein
VHIYQSNGAVIGPNTPRLPDLTSSLDNLMKYNLVIFPCEGAPLPKPRSDQERIVQYANAGGRLFFTHYSWTWLSNLPPFSDTATWNTDQPAPADPLIGTVDQSFPKGKAFAEWLNLVNAAAPLPGLIQIKAPRNDLTAVKGSSQRWIYSTDPATVQHYTFNTPVGATGAAQCGRVVFSDFHVTDVPSIDGATFPSECKPGGLTPQEKVLEFMLFDLANCIQADTVTPELLGPPPVAPPVLPPPVPMSVAPPPVAPPTQPAPAPPAMSPMLPLSSPPAPKTKIPPPPAPPAVPPMEPPIAPPVMPPMAPPPAPPVAPKGE